MAGPYTTASDFLNGVGEFPKQAEGTMLTLLPAEDREKGLVDGLTYWHAFIWERCKLDFLEKDSIDVSGTLTDDQETRIRSICCHMLMAHLYHENSMHKMDSYAAKYQYHKAEYERIRGRLLVIMASGVTTRAGSRQRLVRG